MKESFRLPQTKINVDEIKMLNRLLIGIQGLDG